MELLGSGISLVLVLGETLTSHGLSCIHRAAHHSVKCVFFCLVGDLDMIKPLQKNIYMFFFIFLIFPLHCVTDPMSEKTSAQLAYW